MKIWSRQFDLHREKFRAIFLDTKTGKTHRSEWWIWYRERRRNEEPGWSCEIWICYRGVVGGRFQVVARNLEPPLPEDFDICPLGFERAPLRLPLVRETLGPLEGNSEDDD